MTARGVPARHFCALLLLAAVFSMHGVQCVAADVEAGHGMAGAAHASRDVAATARPGDSAPDVLDHVRTDALQTIAQFTAVAGVPKGSPPAHGALAWVVCLAVVLTGMVLLGLAALVRRLPALLVRARGPSGLWHTGWSRILRPPDLSALCLLRI